MTWHDALWIYTLLLTVLLLGGVAVSIAMGLVGIVGLTLTTGTLHWSSLGDVVWNTTNSFSLTAVPIFVLMGEIILRSGVSSRFYNGVSVLVARLPGGLAQSNILACALFSAVSGSSTATALTIGTVALPEMRKRGYSDDITLGTLTGGGALGNLIPPSILLLIYGMVVQESVIDLFIACVIPGAIVTALFMLFVAVKVKIDPTLVPRRIPSHSGKQIVSALADCMPVTIIIVAIIGGMYGGFVTPTEAAAFGCALCVVLAWLYGEFSLKKLLAALNSTVAINCIILIIIINAQILGFAMARADIGRGMATLLTNADLSPFVFFCCVFVIYLVLGSFLDGISMMLLTVPVLYPSLHVMGFDGIWFGVLLVLVSELAQLTPPVGLNLFAIQSIAGNVSMAKVSMASLPYSLILSAFCFVLYFWPGLATWLPQAMRD